MSNIYYLTVISIVLILILENRNPVKSLSWSLVLIALPVLGLILYVFLGQNVRRSKIISKKSIKQVELINGYYETLKRKFNSQEINLPPSLQSRRRLISLLYKNNHALYSADNDVDIYLSGKDCLDEMFRAIEDAKDYIHLQSYIFENKDEIGAKFTALLQRKAREGVEVRLLVDSVGSWTLNGLFHRKMQKAGVESYEFLKVVFPILTHRINYRNHRKILIVDGKVGFVGGINIADRYYYGDKYIKGLWRDTHMKIQGSAINGLQSTFIQDWYFASQKRIDDKRYFNYEKYEGKRKIQIASCGPDSDWKIIEQAFVLAISSAEDYVYIQSPYFLPTESIRMALMVAAMSGTDVRVMIPHKSDGKFTQSASHSYLKEMLKAGVRIYRYSGGFIHSKMIVADDTLTTIGSSNMDFRSFESNFEVNAFVYDTSIAKRCKQYFLN
ncbi:MAG: cardiolipin synthase, partial [Bacteroidales bacterium]|nr:cardiolipin synthase [Bacteroidales bacterium]